MAILLTALGILLGYMSILFVIGMLTRNNGIADIGYGIAFIVVIFATWMQVPTPSSFVAILMLLPALWAVRLAVRIFIRNHGKPEDFRYKEWRDAWGKTFVVRSFLQVYMLQGLVVFTVALPVTLALAFPVVAPITALAYAGFVLWVIGFYFEAVGDYQLDRFIKNSQNKGRVMASGLWKYSRHPNYFGESLMWVGIAVASAGLTSLPLLAFVSPLLITFLLLKVSGVPLVEKRFEGKPEWEAYKKRTSVFFPLPPKR